MGKIKKDRISLLALMQQEKKEDRAKQQTHKKNKKLHKEENQTHVSIAPVSDKSSFVKLSVTISPEMFDELDELSRKKRKQQKPFKKSDFVREALFLWLKKIRNRK